MLSIAVVIRSIAKAIAWALLGLIAVVVVWFAGNRWLAPAPSQAQDALTKPTDVQIVDSKNAAVAIMGLTAPSGADFLQHGIQVKALYARNAPSAQIQDMVRGPQALRPTVEGKQVICWLDPDWISLKDCLPFERAPAVLAENKELLQRYKAIYALGNYEAVDIYYDDAHMLLARLVIAEMQLDLRKRNYEAAYRKWQQQFQFARRNLRGTDTWVGKAIGLVIIGTTLPFLDSLLNANPDLAQAHAAELIKILRPEGIAAFNANGIARAEFNLLQKALRHPPIEYPEYGVDRIHWLAFYFGQKNRTLNRFAAFAPDYAAVLLSSWSEMETKTVRLRERHVNHTTWDTVLDPFGSLFFTRIVDSQLKAREMVRQMHFTDGHLRLLTLLVHLIGEKVQDNDIPQFLTAADRGLFDHFSGSPARWDQKDRKIYFVDPTDKCVITSLVRVPDLVRRRTSSSSQISMNAC
jgi:hypothetical protein